MIELAAFYSEKNPTFKTHVCDWQVLMIVF
jgi:hypothetical protein